MPANETVPNTVADLMDMYLANRAGVTSHPASLKHHLKALRDRWGAMSLEDICKRGVLRDLCIKYDAERTDISKTTIRKQLTIFATALRWAWRREWIDGLPVMFIPQDSEPKERDFSSADRAVLLSAADKYPTEPHLRAFVYIALNTNEHAGQILEMKWEQVDFKKNHMFFAGRDGKRKQYPLTPQLVEVLQRAQDAAKTKYVIEWRGKKVKTVYRGFSALAKRAGLTINTVDLRLAEIDAQMPKFDEDSPYIFISHCADDGKQQANALVAAVEDAGQRCFIAPRDMKAGPFGGQLTRAIGGAQSFVLLLTPEANESAHVFQEVVKAFNSKKTIVPIIVDNTSFSEDLAHYVDGNQNLYWSNAAKTAQELLQKLKRAV